MDQKLLLYINREWTHPALDWLMAALSSFAVWVPLLVILGVALLIKGGFETRAFICAAALIVAVNDGLVSNSLKHLVDRPRPHQVLDGVRQIDLAKAKPRMLALFRPVKVKFSRATFEEVEGRSFPSSHCVNCFSVAVTGFCFYGARAWWGFVLAGLVGYSRIYTGSHWPSDILTSIVLAGGSTFLLLALAERLWQSAGRRVLPAVHAQHPSLLAA